MRDLQNNVKMVSMLDPEDWNTTKEGLLVNVTGYNGRATIFLVAYEDASQADTERLDVTVHNVASDSEAPAAGNKVAAFTQIVGSNGSAVQKTEQIAVDLEALTSTKKYLQLLLTETNTWEGFISVVIALDLNRYNPVN